MEVKIDNGAKMPTYGTGYSAGMDLYATNEAVIKPHESAVFGTGFHCELRPHTFGLVCNRSGLNFKSGVTLHGNGVIDEDYRGEIKVKLYNDSDCEVKIEKGERIAQMVVLPYIQEDFKQVETLKSSERGESGFGSTGRF